MHNTHNTQLHEDAIREITDGLLRGYKLGSRAFPNTPTYQMVIDNVTALLVTLSDRNSLATEGDKFRLTSAIWLIVAAKYPTIAGHLMEEISNTKMYGFVDACAEAIHNFCQQELGW